MLSTLRQKLSEHTMVRTSAIKSSCNEQMTANMSDVILGHPVGNSKGENHQTANFD